jgi:serine/threonine-protein kinase/endoribonuclease IRE1
MERDPPSPTLVTLERRGLSIVGDDWSKALDRTLLDNLGKYRKYDGASVRDLLRVLRNKVRLLSFLFPLSSSPCDQQKHHYQDLPETVRKNLGDLPGGFLSYFTARFPHLLLHVYDTVATHLADEAMFSSTFKITEDE